MVSLFFLFLVVNKHAFLDYHELRFNSIDGLVEFVELVEFVDVWKSIKLGRDVLESERFLLPLN